MPQLKCLACNVAIIHTFHYARKNLEITFEKIMKSIFCNIIILRVLYFLSVYQRSQSLLVFISIYSRDIILCNLIGKSNCYIIPDT